MGAATAVRVGAGCARLVSRRSGPIVSLALRASFGAGAGSQTAEGVLRDELVALARESAELSWREMRRGVNALDASTRPFDEPRSPTPQRPYRVKA